MRARPEEETMRTVVRLAIAVAVTAIAVIVWESAAAAATAIEYGLIG
jgi:hypothetical protein